MSRCADNGLRLSRAAYLAVGLLEAARRPVRSRAMTALAERNFTTQDGGDATAGLRSHQPG
jgi:hypothetical protein